MQIVYMQIVHKATAEVMFVLLAEVWTIGWIHSVCNTPYDSCLPWTNML